MLRAFHPVKFLGVGGFVDVLVDRGFGPGFNPDYAYDGGLVRLAANLNDMMLDAGMIKPTMMFAYFVKEASAERYYPSRSAQASVRVHGDN